MDLLTKNTTKRAEVYFAVHNLFFILKVTFTIIVGTSIRSRTDYTLLILLSGQLDSCDFQIDFTLFDTRVLLTSFGGFN